MELLRQLILFLHLVGFAALFGGMFVQLKASPRVVNAAMFHGVLTMLVTGLLSVGVMEGLGADLDHVKIAAKLVVALVIAVLVFVNRKKPSLPDGLFLALMGLTLLNAALAVFWVPVHA
jgi:hypothetical protein